MSYADPSDVAVELGRSPSSAAEAEQWQAWIDRTERAIVRGFRRADLDLAVQVELGNPTEADVADVEVAAVIRKIQNPTWGETSYTRSLDDASQTTRRDGAGTSDPLELLPGEWSVLLPAAAGGAFSIRPYHEPDRCDPLWWPFA